MKRVDNPGEVGGKIFQDREGGICKGPVAYAKAS